jgi:hypothetical protein
LISARKKLVGQRVTLENQIRGLAVVFGIQLPRALIPAFVNQALKVSERVTDLSAAMRGLIAARTAVMTDPRQGPAQTQGLGLCDRQAINDAQNAGRSGSPPWGHNARYAAGRNRVRAGLNNRSHETGGRIELPQGATPEGGSRRRRKLQRLIPSRPAPSLPHQVPNEHAKNAGARRHRHLEEASASTH